MHGVDNTLVGRNPWNCQRKRVQREERGEEVPFSIPNGSGSMKIHKNKGKKTEYFLIEVRDFSGWDRGLVSHIVSTCIGKPELCDGWSELDTMSGFLILHVDEKIVQEVSR